MARNNRATVKTRRRQQRPKHDHEQTLDLFATYLMLCGCWSNQPTHTCGQAPPRYCTCGSNTNEGCVCPSPIGRVA